MELNNEILGTILSFLSENFDDKIHYIQDNKCYYNGVAVGDINYDYDEENNILNMYYHPYQEIKSIEVTFVISKSGTEFDDK